MVSEKVLALEDSFSKQEADLWRINVPLLGRNSYVTKLKYTSGNGRFETLQPADIGSKYYSSRLVVRKTVIRRAFCDQSSSPMSQR